MAKVVSIDIWSSKQPVEVINGLKNGVQGFKETLNTTCSEIVSELLNDGKEYATIANALAPHGGLDHGIVDIDKDDGLLYLKGKNAVYDEFGTGTQGESNPHPMKGNFDLNPYNSGPYIFYNQFASAYQWYYRPMAGKPYFTESGLTEGIPSGKQMYNTLQHIYSIKRDITKKHLDEAMDELVYAMERATNTR